MESLLVLLAADLVVTTTLTTLQLQTRRRILKRWCEGSLNLEELKVLKQTSWFRRLWKPTTQSVASSKKQD